MDFQKWIVFLILNLHLCVIAIQVNEPPSTPTPPPPAPPLPPPPPPGKDGNKTPTVSIIVVSIALGLILIAICIFIILRKLQKRKAKSYANYLSWMDPTSSIDDIGAVKFDFITIQKATNNFLETNMVGEGGFGAIYKGKLQDGQQVAVKRLSKNLREGNLEFKNEVALMAKLQHRNLVRLLGFSLEGKEMLLVYEYVPNGSLDNILFDPLKRRLYLDWRRSYKIIESIARGLIYLHQDSRLHIIHCNLKASNVLLDADLNPKIADFDMARLFALDNTHGSTSRIVGTDRYMAPDYVLQGEISVKSDVYSFGLLVLEIISGQKTASFENGESTKDLLSYAWTHWKGGSASNVIDPMLRGTSSPVHEITKCIHIALLCVQENVADRPTMAEVLQMLSNLSMSLPVPLAPGFFIHGSVSSEASSQFTKNEMSISDQYHRKMQKRKAKSYAKTLEETSSVDEISAVESLKYDFITLQNATDNFSKVNMIWEGYRNAVYKGKLENGLEVAVKRLSSRYRWEDFKNEVALLAKLQHRNLVRLLGFCLRKKEMFLVYEFVPNGGLDQFLFDPVKRGYLDWGRRYRIIEGIARGLVYLREDSRLCIVRRCLSASDVLLDADLNPKISGFGLAWLCNSDETHADVVEGTFGYIAPEYALQHEIYDKLDVYSFGVLVLEIISGRRNVSFEHEEDLISYAWTHWANGSSLNVIDPMLRGISSPVHDIIRCIHVVLLCVKKKVADRPTMAEVLQMLGNLSMSLPVPLAPKYFIHSRVSSEDSEASEASEAYSINEMSISDDEFPR